MRETAVDELIDGHRRELLAHCYRMLGSPGDAEDALAEALRSVRRGLPGLDVSASRRGWLYRVTTHACLRQIAGRPGGLEGPGRMCPTDRGPAGRGGHEPGAPGPGWLEPLPDELLDRLPEDAHDDPAASYQRREAIELAFVAALAHLPAIRRAVLILRQVLGFSAEETALALGSTPASVRAELDRARRTVAARTPDTSQRVEVAALGRGGRETLVERFVTAVEQADVPALLGLLAEDARLVLPPRPGWFDGREEIGRFLTARPTGTPGAAPWRPRSWRLRPRRINSQLGFACYRGPSGRGTAPFVLDAVAVIAVRSGLITGIGVFSDQAVLRRMPFPTELGPSGPESGATEQ